MNNDLKLELSEYITIYSNTKMIENNKSSIIFDIVLFIIFKVLEEGKSPSDSVAEMIYSVSIPNFLQQKLVHYISEYDVFIEVDYSRISTGKIHNYFFTKRINNSSSTRIPSALFWLIDESLNLTDNDTLAEFYGDGLYSKYVYEEKHLRDIFYFEQDEDIWLLHQMRNNVLKRESPYHYYNEDITSKNFKTKQPYKKLFAFPPIFQKVLPLNESFNIRSVQNVERTTEDKTEQLIDNVISSLEEEGRAAVVVSNAIFTRNYSEYQKKLVDERYLTRIINLPLGTIYPRNINSSILVFNKSSKNNVIRFFDLRSFGPNQNEIYHFDNVFAHVSKEMVTSLFSTFADTPYSATVFYENIIENDYDLNSSTYIGGDYKKKNIEIVGEETAAYENKKENFILGKEAVIFRGLQDTSAIREIEPSYLDKERGYISEYRLLKITDIVDNRITESMVCIQKPENEFDKFRLTKRDIIISKTTTPIKVAIPESDKIYPAANFFIIRLNQDSKLNRYYLKCYLESEEGLKQLKMLDSGGALPSFTKGNLEKIEVPFMDILEQEILEQKYRDCESTILKLEKDILLTRENQRKLI